MLVTIFNNKFSYYCEFFRPQKYFIIGNINIFISLDNFLLLTCINDPYNIINDSLKYEIGGLETWLSGRINAIF